MEKSALALIIASAMLTACGGGSSGSSGTSTADDPIAGDTASFALCHDTNLDGSCTDENTSGTYETLVDAKAATVINGVGPVLITGTDGTFLTAEASSNNANAWSSLEYNETLFNPGVGSDESDIRAYLGGKLGFDNNLSDEQVAAFESSIAAAINAFPDENPYKILGAVVDTAVESGSLDNAMPTAANIASQSVLSWDVDGEISPESVATWETSDGDERVQMIRVQGNKTLIVNRWHNTIAITDIGNVEQTVTSQPFAALITSGHHIESTDVDYITGASEHTLTDAWLNDSGDALYALIPGPDSSVTDDDTYGLFHIPLVNGALPEHSVTVGEGETAVSYNVPHRHESVTRIENTALEDAINLSDGRILAYDTNAGYVRVYSADLTEDTASAFPLDSSLLNWAVTDDALILLRTDTDSSTGATLERRAINALATVEHSLVLSESANVLLSGSDTPWLVVLDGTELVQISAELEELARVDLGSEPSSSIHAMSPDGLLVALSTDNGIQLVNLGEAFPILTGVIEIDGRLRAMALNGTDELLYSDDGGTLKHIDLSATDLVKTNISALIESAISAISDESINHGYDLDAVIYPMDMPTQQGPVSYEWNTSDSLSNIVITDGSDQQGHITQPSIGESNVSGSISVAASYTFRGDSTTSDTHTFDIKIRPTTKTVSHTLTSLTGDWAGAYFSLLAANSDGSQAAAVVTGDDDTGVANRLAIINQSNGTVTLESPIEFPQEHANSTTRGLVWNGTQVYVVTESDEHDYGHILSYETTTNTWVDEVTLSGTVGSRSVGISQDGTTFNLSVEIDGTYTARTYTTSDLSLVANIETDATRSLAMTTSNNGQHVMGYSRNGDGRSVSLYSADTDSAPEGQYGFSSSIYGHEYDNQSDTLFSASRTGDIYLFSNAVSGSDFSNPSVFETARGNYIYPAVSVTTSSRAGRFYYFEASGNYAYGWSYLNGVVGLDISNPAAIQEVFWSPLPMSYGGDLSTDGSTLFTHTYDADSGQSQIGVIQTADAITQ